MIKAKLVRQDKKLSFELKKRKGWEIRNDVKNYSL